MQGTEADPEAKGEGVDPGVEGGIQVQKQGQIQMWGQGQIHVLGTGVDSGVGDRGRFR